MDLLVHSLPPKVAIIADPGHQKLMCLMVFDARVDTTRGLFGYSGLEPIDLQPEDIDSGITDKT